MEQRTTLEQSLRAKINRGARDIVGDHADQMSEEITSRLKQRVEVEKRNIVSRGGRSIARTIGRFALHTWLHAGVVRKTLTLAAVVAVPFIIVTIVSLGTVPILFTSLLATMPKAYLGYLTIGIVGGLYAPNVGRGARNLAASAVGRVVDRAYRIVAGARNAVHRLGLGIAALGVAVMTGTVAAVQSVRCGIAAIAALPKRAVVSINSRVTSARVGLRGRVASRRNPSIPAAAVEAAAPAAPVAPAPTAAKVVGTRALDDRIAAAITREGASKRQAAKPAPAPRRAATKRSAPADEKHL